MICQQLEQSISDTAKTHSELVKGLQEKHAKELSLAQIQHRKEAEQQEDEINRLQAQATERFTQCLNDPSSIEEAAPLLRMIDEGKDIWDGLLDD
jgi:hypothetical protein